MHRCCACTQVVLLVGDMAYADNYSPDGTLRPPGAPATSYWQPTYQPRWDSWARFVQPLASKALPPRLHLLGCTFHVTGR